MYMFSIGKKRIENDIWYLILFYVCDLLHLLLFSEFCVENLLHLLNNL